MTLIKSISGIRGTIGGAQGTALTPLDTVKFTSGFGEFIIKRSNNSNPTIVVGRDARISGPVIEQLVIGTLRSQGINVINLGLASTPTVEMAVPAENAQGGIILTASHNPGNWNALKLLNEKGEFINDAEGKEMLKLAEDLNCEYAEVENLGSYREEKNHTALHIEAVKKLDLVDVAAIAAANFTVAVDAVNSVGGIAIPQLLKELGVKNIIELYCNPNGKFPHNPEPLPENLTEISEVIKKQNADVGFVVDPDVDRLALVTESGEMFGEEYTLVAVADYILSNTPGNTVSNLSSTRALRDVTEKHGGQYHAAAVGEVNVVAKMKEVNAIIGGEGNGGVIYPELHYGRDALVGIALILTHMAKTGKKPSELRSGYPEYHISKNKIALSPQIDVDKILAAMEKRYANEQVNTIDGVKVDFENEWFHLRKSNTEPIIRIYTESNSVEAAERLADKIKTEINDLI